MLPRTRKKIGDDKPIDGVQSVMLAIRILESVAASYEQKRITDLADEFSTTKTRVFRHLKTLAENDYVTHDASTGRYGSGPKLILLGQIVLEKLSLIHEAKPVMRELREQLGHSVGLSQIIGKSLYTVEVESGASPFSITTLRGSKQTLHATALGKIALAFGGLELGQGIDDLSLEPVTAHTIIDRELLKIEVAGIAKKGWAVAPNEMNVGINALAAPIFDGRNKFIGAIAALDLTHLLPAQPSIEQIQAVVSAAKLISRRLGHS